MIFFPVEKDLNKRYHESTLVSQESNTYKKIQIRRISDILLMCLLCNDTNIPYVLLHEQNKWS
jgi:uncharacterized protein (UPF0248 family)